MIEGHGDDLYRYERPIIANFSSNVYDGISNKRLRRHLSRLLQQEDCIGSYPEPQPYSLEIALAGKLHVDVRNVCVTSGATAAIYLIAQTFHGSTSAIVQPTFAEYADAAGMSAHRVLSKYLTGNEEADLCIEEGVHLVWICNPNNPTGVVLPKDFLKRICQENPDVVFVIDQSYEDFTQKALFTSKEVVDNHPNVLLLHSMTKHFAVPGIRLGYITGAASLLDHVKTHRMPWSVGRLASESGLFLLSEEPEPFDLAELLRESQFLRDELRKIAGLEVWQSDTHFMLVRMRYGNAKALKEYLAEEHGILIRDASNFEGLDEHFFRVATQQHPHNILLIEALRQWMES